MAIVGSRQESRHLHGSPRIQVRGLTSKIFAAGENHDAQTRLSRNPRFSLRRLMIQEEARNGQTRG
jgi:hypothetical protein